MYSRYIPSMSIEVYKMRRFGKRIVAGCLAALMFLPNTAFALYEGIGEESPVPGTGELFVKPAEALGEPVMGFNDEEPVKPEIFAEQDKRLKEADEDLTDILAYNSGKRYMMSEIGQDDDSNEDKPAAETKNPIPEDDKKITDEVKKEEQKAEEEKTEKEETEEGKTEGEKPEAEESITDTVKDTEESVQTKNDEASESSDKIQKETVSEKDKEEKPDKGQENTANAEGKALNNILSSTNIADSSRDTIEARAGTKNIVYNKARNEVYANSIPIYIQEYGDKTKIYSSKDGAKIEIDDTNEIIDGTTGVEINENTTVYGGSNEDSTEELDSTSITFKSGKIGNIYGGSYSGKVTTTNVIINGGTISGNGLICAGGRAKGSDVVNANLTVTDFESAEKTAVWIYGGGCYSKVTTSKVEVLGGRFDFVLGGGVAGATETATVKIGKNAYVNDTVFGGGWRPDAIITKSSSVEMSGGSARFLYGGSYNASSTKTASVTLSGGDTSVVYGGSMLEKAETGDTSVSLEGGAVQWVYGGSEYGGILAGSTGNASLTIEDGVTFKGSGSGAVFGGGQVSDAGDTTVTVNGSNIPVLYGGCQLGNVKNTAVNVNDGKIGTLYGGCSTKSSEKDASAETTSVTVSGGEIDYLYGGSYAAKVTQKASVALGGGSVGEVYGGGVAVGVAPVEATEVNVSGGKVNYLYGGGCDGTVGTAMVNVSGGKILRNLYGGGRSTAATTTTATVKIEGGDVPHVFGGGEYGSVDESTLTLLSDVGFACGGGYNAVSKKATSSLTGCKANTLCGGNYAAAGASEANITIDNTSDDKKLGLAGQLICGDSQPDGSATPETTLNFKDGRILQMYPGYRDKNNSKFVIDGGSIPKQYFGQQYDFVNSSGQKLLAVDVLINEPARVEKDVTVSLGGSVFSHTRTDSNGKLVLYLPENTAFTSSNPLTVNMAGVNYKNTNSTINKIVNSVTVSDTSQYKVSFGAYAKGDNTSVGAVTGSGTVKAVTADGTDFTSGQTVAAGTRLKFTATPDNGDVFVQWWINGSTYSNPETTFAITSDMVDGQGVFEIKAEFAKGYAIKFEVGKGGTPMEVTEEDSQKTLVSGDLVWEGANVKFIITPMNGYTFSKLLVNGTDSISSARKDGDSYVYEAKKVSNDMEVKAEFTYNGPVEPTEYKISHSCTNGSITVMEKATKGTSVKVTAVPDAGYRLSSLSWSYEDASGNTVDSGNKVEAGIGSGDSFAFTFVMPGADVIVAAVFEPIPKHKINVTKSSGSGNVTLSDGVNPIIAGETLVEENTLVTVKADAQSGDFSSISFTCSGEQIESNKVSEREYTFTMPAGEVEIKVSFKSGEGGDTPGPSPVPGNTVSAEVKGKGRVEVDPSLGSAVDVGDPVTVTAKPDIGYELKSMVLSFIDKSGNVVKTEPIISGYIFDMPDYNVKITAEFVVIDSGGGNDDKPGGDDDSKPGDDDNNKPADDDDDDDYDNNGGSSGDGGGSSGGGGGSSGGSSGGNASGGNAAGNANAGGTAGGSGKDDATSVGKPDEIKVQVPEGQSSSIDGRVSVTMPYNEIERALKENKAENADLHLIPSVNSSPDAADFIITMEAVQLMIDNSINSLLVEHPVGPSLRIDGSALKNIYSQSGHVVKLSVEPVAALSTEATAKIGDRPVYSIRLTVDGSPVTSFGEGFIRLRLPYNPRQDEDTAYIKACYIDGEGKVDVFVDSKYISEDGVVEADTPHLSVFGVVYTKDGSAQFTDIDGHWAEDAILELAGLGIVKGMTTTEFKPDDLLKRGMLITLMGRMSGVGAENPGDTGFTDVPANAYYAPYISWAKEKGLAQGMGDGRFQPMANITREQLAVFIYRYSELKGKTIPLANAPELFDDDVMISDWAKEAVYALREAGILNGMGDNNYDPRSGATRAQVCSLLQRIM